MELDDDKEFEVTRDGGSIRIEFKRTSHGWGKTTDGESLELATIWLDVEEAKALLQEIIGAL